MEIREVEHEEDLRRVLPILQQLREELSDAAALGRFSELRKSGYRLVCGENDGSCVGVAGFRIILGGWNWLSYLYCEELVVDSTNRSRRFGEILLRYLEREAILHGCHSIHLDSGVHRFDAHRFYLNQKFRISHHHFRKEIGL